MAEAFNPEDWIYTVEDFKFTVDGKEYPVSSVYMSNADNGIPGIQLTLAAVGSVDSTTETVTLAKLIEYQNELQAKAGLKETKVHLSFTVTSAKDTQKISLDKWVLSAAGIDPAAYQGALTARVTLLHPIHLSTTSTLTLYNYTDHSTAPDDIDGANVMEAILSVMKISLDNKSDDMADLYGDDNESTEDKIEALNSANMTKAQNAYEALKKNIVWKGAGGANYPADDDSDADMDAVIKQFLWNNVQMDGATPYQTFDSLCGEMMLCRSGDFSDDPVWVHPIVAWAPVRDSVYDTDLINVSLPANDPDPIAGTMVQFETAKGTNFGFMRPDYIEYLTKSKPVMPEEINGAGLFLDYAASLMGRIRILRLPPWIVAMIRSGASSGDFGMTETNDPGKMDQVYDNESSALYNTDMEDVAAITNIWAKDMFYQTYRASTGMSLTCRFMMNLESGKSVRPAMGMALKERATGRDLMYFTVIRVNHYIDVDKKRAYSKIVGQFVRPPEGITAKEETVISADQAKNGIENFCYNFKNIRGE